MSRTRTLEAPPAWIDQLWQRLTRQALLIAAFATVVLVLATALPAWAARDRGSTAPPMNKIVSSEGVTGTAATRVPDLGAASFVGRIPFVQESRFLSAVSGGGPAGEQFIQGAREANLARYIDDVGMQMMLPYASSAIATRQAIDLWTWVSAANANRQLALQYQAAVRSPSGSPIWQAPAYATGTRLASTVTFYACISDGFCGTMSNGQEVFPGAAACSTNLPFGTRFVINADPTARVFTCLDRGALTPTWVDIWFYDIADGWAWQSNIGTSSDITILN